MKQLKYIFALCLLLSGLALSAQDSLQQRFRRMRYGIEMGLIVVPRVQGENIVSSAPSVGKTIRINAQYSFNDLWAISSGFSVSFNYHKAANMAVEYESNKEISGIATWKEKFLLFEFPLLARYHSKAFKRLDYFVEGGISFDYRIPYRYQFEFSASDTNYVLNAEHVYPFSFAELHRHLETSAISVIFVFGMLNKCVAGMDISMSLFYKRGHTFLANRASKKYFFLSGNYLGLNLGIML